MRGNRVALLAGLLAAATVLPGCAVLNGATAVVRAESAVRAAASAEQAAALRVAIDAIPADGAVSFTVAGVEAGLPVQLTGSAALAGSPLAELRYVHGRDELHALVRGDVHYLAVSDRYRPTADKTPEVWTRVAGAGSGPEAFAVARIDEDLADLHPRAQLGRLVALGSAAMVGHDEFGGGTAVHYSVTVPMERYQAIRKASLREYAAKLYQDAGVATITAEAWIDAGHRLLRTRLRGRGIDDVTISYRYLATVPTLPIPAGATAPA